MTAVQLVNEQDEPIGEMDVVAAHRGSGRLHRAASVFLFRVPKQGEPELLLQQRSAQKIVGALQWANTACGNVRPNESYQECAQRRLQQELGVSAVTLSEIGVFRYQVQCNDEFSENEIDHVFAGLVDGDPTINPDEVQQVAWYSWPKLQAEYSGATLERELVPWFALMLEDTALCAKLTRWISSAQPK